MKNNKQDKIIETCSNINKYLDNLDIESYTEHYLDWLLDETALEHYLNESGYENEIKELISRYGKEKTMELLHQCTTYEYRDTYYLRGDEINYIDVGEIEVELYEFGSEWDADLINYTVHGDYVYLNTNGHWAAVFHDYTFENEIEDLLKLPDNCTRIEIDTKRRYISEIEDEDQAVLCFKTGNRVA